MPIKIIKLGRKEDLGSVIKQIKSLRDREVIFEVEKGSPLLANSDSLKIMKKAGEVLGKKVKVQTTDETGRMLAKKAGVLADETFAGIKVTKSVSRVSRSDVKPRFSDIIAPRHRPVRKVSATPSKFGRPVSQDETEGSRMEFSIDRSSSKFSKIFILFLVVLVIAVFGLAVLLPKADITVFARSEPITRDFEVKVDKSVGAADPDSMQIPGISVSKEVSQTKSFPTTGAKVSGTKASGSVVIYNFTPNTLTLKATTTTLVADGKKYFFTKNITGIKGNGGSTAGIEIVAEKAGEEYNLPANSKFQIVNAALGSANVNAENLESLTGGTTGTSTKILSQEDIDKATNVLIEDIISQAEADLTAENSVKIRLLDSGGKIEILAKTANKDVGDQTDRFDMTLIAKVSGLAFKEDNVSQVVVTKINEVLSSDKYLLDSVQQKFSSNFKSIDPTYTKGVLAVHFETIAAYKVDAANLPKVLAGKNGAEIKEILLSKPEIDNVGIKFWPEWFVHKAPKFNGKINISTVLSQTK